MTNSAILIKGILLSAVYILLLNVYLTNEFNKQTIGIISDSFWLTGVSTLYVILLLQKTRFRLSNFYFRIKKVEYSAKIYKSIGIMWVKKIIQKYPLPNATLKINLNGVSQSDILDIENRMKDAEQVHVFGALLVFTISVFFAIKRDGQFLIWFTIFNIFLNLYPIFLQRYNRNRIRLILSKYK